MLLLHLMAALFPNRVRAIYIDHQLQQSSAAWGEFVRQNCQNLHIPIIIQPVQVAHGNLENQARQARYAAFHQHLQDHEILVLAHHQQDQAETVLLRLFSGAGVQGLSGMKMLDYRENLTLWRPLLNLTREQICQWAAQLNVQNIYDCTNSDIHYDRAWCREQLWPLLQMRFPQMQHAIARTSFLMQDANSILNDVLQQDWQLCGDQYQLNLTQYARLSAARQRQLLSAWMKGEDIYRPSLDMVQRLQQEVIDSKQDAQAKLHYNSFYYLRYQRKLYKISAEQDQKQIILKTEIKHWQLEQKIQVAAGHFILQTQDIGLSHQLLQQNLTLSPRLGGEKIHLYGRLGRWALKKALQEAQIPPWERQTIQILSVDNVILGVFTPKGFWLAQSDYCEHHGWQPVLINSGQFSTLDTKNECGN